MKRHGTWALGVITVAAVIFHPTPWCIGCETDTPFGHVSSRMDDVLQFWLIAVPFLAGLLNLEKGWLAPLFMVTAQLMAQFVGGEPWLDFEGSEGPFIVLFGLPVCFLFLIAGYGARHFIALIRQAATQLRASHKG